MTSRTTSTAQTTSRWYGILNLLIVYIVWGSTYLAIRVGVREGSGFPPFYLAGTRVLVAGIILIGLAWLQKKPILLTKRELGLLAISGVMLWLGGNGLVVYAEQHVDSNLAALIIGSTPLGVALMEFIIDRRPPSSLMVVSLLIGFGGVGLLSIPSLRSGVSADALSVILILCASMLWGGGSLLQSRKPVKVEPEVSSAVQHLTGAVALFSMALITGEPLPHPVQEALFAWGYLVIFGSVVAFTAFVRALQMLPTNLVMTYAYVNPVIAVLLGWLILGEKITPWTLGGMALILVGVAGVFRARYRQARLPKSAN
ncbi:MAG: EamA family transporter [Anaerolinea sp.]|nr:EamA family transporter [Anaerolinea sp.]